LSSIDDERAKDLSHRHEISCSMTHHKILEKEKAESMFYKLELSFADTPRRTNS
jgi:hypothetical protein